MPDYKWLNFINGFNSLKISNDKQFDCFKTFLDDIGLKELLQGRIEYSDWQYLSKINGYDPNCIIFEIQPDKGLSFGYTEASSKEWFGVEPLTAGDLLSFYRNSNLNNQLCDLQCTVSKMEDYISNNWYQMGYTSKDVAFADFFFKSDSEIEENIEI